MSERYDHKSVEKKWQQRWQESQIFRTDDNSTKPKTYVLDMFPYPSGAGLHVGHVEGYTATDIYARFKRMQGYNVLHPMGWDAFGLPAENYAIKTGIPPATTTNDAIQAFRSQMQKLGFSYDWEREFGTHTPEYYKWTQWFFLFLYKNGLAEKKFAKVNWCPKDQTVLANEQVVDGHCERCGSEVIQKDLEQWFFKITEFADALVDDLDEVDWPSSTKIAQRNWIGRNHGIRYSLTVKDTGLRVETYSTHFEAFWADTFAVIAPDHPRLGEIIGDLPEKTTILARAKEITDERERAAYGAELEPEGVFIGRYLLDPITNTELPLWVANYALAEYGTGIIKCSAHDERDFKFAKKYHLPLRIVLEPTDPALREKVLKQEVCFSDFANAMLLFPAEFVGKKPSNERENILEYLVEKGYGVRSTQYRLRDWLISRQRYWGAPIPVVYDPAGKAHPVPEEHLPWLLPTDVEFRPTGTSPLAQSKEFLERTEKIFGPGWRPEVDTMDTFVCSSWYFLRFADPHNKREFASRDAMAQWLPVDLYVGGAEHTVLHLLYARFFTKALKKFGHVTFNEPFLRLRHQGTILAEDGNKMSKSKGNTIDPNDVVERYGADTLRLYEMFMGPLEATKPWNTKNIAGTSRFIERVWRLFEKGVSEEPAKEELEMMLHKTAKKVGEDIEAFKFNTAVSQMMTCLNAMEKSEAGLRRGQWEVFIRLLAPFAPHLAEELWERLGEPYSVHQAPWPQFDEAKLSGGTTKIGIQVNGKARGSIELTTSGTQVEALAAARANPAVAKWLAQGTVVKEVYVPGKVVSFVVE